jgi:hypothetical protein
VCFCTRQSRYGLVDFSPTPPTSGTTQVQGLCGTPAVDTARPATPVRIQLAAELNLDVLNGTRCIFDKSPLMEQLRAPNLVPRMLHCYAFTIGDLYHCGRDRPDCVIKLHNNRFNHQSTPHSLDSGNPNDPSVGSLASNRGRIRCSRPLPSHSL